MNEKENLNRLIDLWYCLTPPQRKRLALRARLYLAESALYLLILRIFLIVARLMVPVPRRITAHYL